MKENFLNNPDNYRQNKDSISQNFQEIWSSSENKKVLPALFFGVPQEVLSDDEIENFKIFCTYADKRILNTNLHRDSVDENNLEDYLSERSEEYNSLLVFHDIGHSIAVYSMNKKENQNSVTPEQFKMSNVDTINNKEVLEEEVFSAIWSPVFFKGDLPLSTALLNTRNRDSFIRTLRKPENNIKTRTSINLIFDKILDLSKQDTLENYIKTYLDVAYFLIENNNHKEITRNYKDEKEIISLEDEFCKVVNKLKDNPNPQLLESLSRVYKDKNNPKVLYDEFFKICSPLIEKLKKRKS